MKKIKHIILALAIVVLMALALPDNAQAATSVKLDKKSLTTYVGGQTQLTMTGNTKNVKWSSSKSSVASVSSKGLVTAKKAGKTVITVKAGSKKATCNVTVKKQLTTKQVISNFNKTIKKTTNFSVDLYHKSIKKSNLMFATAINTKKGIMYINAPMFGLGKMYTTKSRVYWYDAAAKKWYYCSNQSDQSDLTSDLSDMSITSDMKCKSLGNKKFNGKKCFALQYTVEDEKGVYYFDLSDYSLIGAESGSGDDKSVMVIDMKTTVSIPSSVTKKATYKEFQM